MPTLLLFFIAGGFVTSSFERWLDIQVENALQGSLEIGQTYYQNSGNNALFYARQLSQRIASATVAFLTGPARSRRSSISAR